LELVAGKYYDGDKFVPVGLPFGAKARLVLLYINQRAVRGQSPVVDVGDSLTSFVARILKLDTGGKTITAVKLQLLLLSACQIRFGWIGTNGRPQTENPAGIMRGFEMWAPKETNERVRWPSEVRLSNEYWTTLKEQAVPLEEQHIRALSHSGMALDIYAWLAHRLHRVPEGKPALVAWPLLQDQFGAEIGRLRNFRQLFRIALKQVVTLYRDANIHDTPAGLILNKSPPIVKPRISIVVSSPIGSNS